MAERSLRFDLIARDKSFSKTLDQMGRKGQSLNRKLERAFGDSGGRAGQQYGMRFSQRLGSGLSASTRIARLSGAAIGTGLAVAGLGKFAADSVKLATTFDKTMRQVASVTKVPVARIGELRKIALDMGAKTSFSARQAGEAMLELGKGGLTFAEQKAGGLSATLTLAAAGSLELGEAAGFVVQGLKAFGLRADQAATVSAALAGAANASTASVDDMGLSLSQTAAGARNAGLSIQETTGVLAAFANNGIKGSDAGTSLKTMLQRLIPETEKARNKMADLGLKFTDARGAMLPITEIAQRLKDRLSGLSDAQRSSALATIFGSDATRAATILMREGSAGLAKYIKATSDRGAAEKLAKTNTEGAAGAFERLQGAIETIQIQIGDAFLPVLANVANWLARVLPAALDRIQRALQTAGHWWSENRYEIDLISKSLAVGFNPAAKEAASSTDAVGNAASRVVGFLSALATGVARTSQAYNALIIASQSVSFFFGNLIQAIGQVANAIDFASKGFGLFGDKAGHAGDSIVALGRDIEGKAVGAIGNARVGIDQASIAIGGLQGEETAELDVKQAKINVSRAQERLTELAKAGRKGSLDYRQAQLDLRRAQIDLKDKTDAYKTAQAKANAATGGAMHASQQAQPSVYNLGEAARKGGNKAGDARTPWRQLGDQVSGTYREIHNKTARITANFGWKGLQVFRVGGGGPAGQGLKAFAAGGRIAQGSGPTADDVLIRASRGETVVSARDSADPDFQSWAAAKRIPGFKLGGVIPQFGMTGQRGFVRALAAWPDAVERVLDRAAARFKKFASQFSAGRPGVLNFIRSVDPLPYVWGAAGPGAYDCSGLVSAVYGKHTGRGGGRGQRYFTTGTIGTGTPGLRPGLGGVLQIGVTPGRGHMAGRYGGPHGLGFQA